MDRGNGGPWEWRTGTPSTILATLYDAHSAYSDFCFLAPDINTLTYLLTRPSTGVLDKILDRVLEQ